MPHLINSKILHTKVATSEHLVSGSRAQDRENLKHLLLTTYERIQNKTFSKEEAEKPVFLPKFFELLGYTHPTTYRLEESTKGRSADVALGQDMSQENSKITVAGEWKGIDTKDLERGKAGETPVAQLFSYMNTLGSAIGIVSNFLEIRIYTWDKRQERYYTFSLESLEKDPSKINELFYLLRAEHVLTDTPEITQLADATTEQEKRISKEFYQEFKTIRLSLFEHLRTHNSSTPDNTLLEKSQKILDRIIFILFCEDTNNLLPNGLLKRTHQLGLDSFEEGDEKVWKQFKGIFSAIDTGRTTSTITINAYNGGLFKPDNVLDTLHIKDTIWESIVNLSKYDFDSELNVNILGHIFEQSISDLEHLKSELAGETIDAKKSKRKKDGIYYTPEYITKYIVENTVGKWLEENPNKLEQIKILDPACGSGAFLNQAHSYLLTKYKEQDSLNQETATDKISLDFETTETQNKIKALKSLYGVDLQAESVEISKLSLWLKTADREHKLENLDDQIKCGNSLIDDPAVAGDKAFDWNTEYSEIMSQGGFDVIVGNPPYVSFYSRESQGDATTQSVLNYSINKYDFITDKDKNGRYNTVMFFIEQALRLLKTNGYLCFIIDTNFHSNPYEPLRKYLLKKYAISNIADNLDVFEDVGSSQLIITIKKTDPARNEIEYRKINETNHNVIKKISQAALFTNQFSFIEPKSEKVSLILEKISAFQTMSDILGEENVRTTISFTGKKDSFIRTNKSSDKDYPLLEGSKGVSGPYSGVFFDTWMCYDLVLRDKLNREYIEQAKSEGKRSAMSIALGNLDRFKAPKLFIRLSDTRVTATYTNMEACADLSLYIVTLPNLGVENDNYYLHYILAILNSKLITFYFRENNWIRNLYTGTPQIRVSDLKKTPIPFIPKNEQTILYDLAKKILDLNEEKANILSNTKDFLSSTYTITIKKSLPAWEDLLKQISKLSIDKQSELHTWYQTKKSEIEELEKQIQTVDDQIDQEVYRLYGLSEEEVKVVEGSKEITY